MDVLEWQVEGWFDNDPIRGKWSILNDEEYGVQWPVAMETAIEIWDLLKQAGYDIYADRFRITNVMTGEVILCTIL